MILIVGASRGLGKDLGKVFSDDIKTLLVSRSKIEKYNKNIETVINDINLLNFETILRKIPEKNISAIYFTIGVVNKNDDIFLDEKKSDNILRSNYYSITRLAYELINKNKLSNNCLICFCSSVTTIIPRNKQINYCAAKNALNSYYESLRAYIFFNNLKFRVSNLILGYLDTSMSDGIETPFKKLDPIRLSRKIKKNYKTMKGTFYIPKYWFLINILTSLIPKRLLFFLLKLFKI